MSPPLYVRQATITVLSIESQDARICDVGNRASGVGRAVAHQSIETADDIDAHNTAAAPRACAQGNLASSSVEATGQTCSNEPLTLS
jgi:hypothetical protein